MLFELENKGGSIDVNVLVDIARKAGEAILTIYNDVSQAEQVTYKEDNSPLTLADMASHKVISQRLAEITPDIPLLSEEGKHIPYDERKQWEYYWCVDPLDGTKEFVKRNGEFTVNIALIHRDQPVLGIIYQPVENRMYFGGLNIGSWKTDAKLASTRLYAHATGDGITAVGSRTHADPAEEKILAAYAVTQVVAVGSSLKFCLIAEGKAQIYYRHGPTMEWDTAAGHAIAYFSGAVMTTPTGEAFLYNKPSLLNGSFLCKVPHI